MSAAWGAQDVRDWLRPAFEWLTERWAAGSPRTWDELSGEFLGQLGLQEHTEFPVVHRLFDRIAGLSDEDGRRALLFDAAARDTLVDELIEQWVAGRAAPAARHDPEPYWDGTRWLMWDSVGLQWKPMAPDEAPVDTGGRAQL